MDFDFGEIIENRQHSQENIGGEICKEEIMDRSYPDVALDNLEKQRNEEL